MTTPLQQAAQALLDRWDSMNWKDALHTAHFIFALRKALDAELQQSVEPVLYIDASTLAMAAAHKVERDALTAANRDLQDWFDALKTDHDALKDAARLALDALEKSTRYFNIVRLGESRLKDTVVRGDCHTAMNALKAVL